MTSPIWTDPSTMVSVFFSVKECIFLPTWNRLADGLDGLNDHVKKALLDFCNGYLDRVRNEIGLPVLVNCMYRPKAYNELPAIGGAEHSAHMCEGSWAACDFVVPGLRCDDVRARLAGLLNRFELRMENRPGSNWVHVDNRPPLPGQDRFFRP